MASTPHTIPHQAHIYTHNITRRPIAWDPTTQRPTQELVHAVHSALHFALDPCLSHPDEAPSFSVVDVPCRGVVNRRLVVPSLHDVVPKAAMQNAQGEITVKLFAGFDGAEVSRMDVDDALEALYRVTGVRDVAKFVVSLDRVKWCGATEKVCADGHTSWMDGIGEVDKLKGIWEYLSAQPNLRTLGVADFSPDHLARLCKILAHSEPSCPSECMAAPKIRPPKINQLNFDTDLPPSLTQFASQKGISLVSHSDDLGSLAQIVNLLREFRNVIPLPSAIKGLEPPKKAEDVLHLDWVLKYTILLPDRGLVLNTGYIMAASFLTRE